MNSYLYKPKAPIVTDSLLSPYKFLILRDAPRDLVNSNVSKEYFNRYISDMLLLFKEHIDRLGAIDKPLSEEDERHLHLLLNILIEAKHIWHEEYVAQANNPGV